MGISALVLQPSTQVQNGPPLYPIREKENSGLKGFPVSPILSSCLNKGHLSEAAIFLWLQHQKCLQKLYQYKYPTWLPGYHRNF